jgi:release factor glutamine methyltransferase
MPTIKELLSNACSKLTGPDARQEAELLLEVCCSISRSQLFSHPEKKLTAEQVKLFNTALQRRLSGEPLAYIAGSRGFWDMELKLSPDVLIPRPDSECLVEQALARIPLETDWQIADLGTGSGAIAIAIARERPRCTVTATDISEAALDIARQNSVTYAAENVMFASGSWGQALGKGVFNMIVSNPPYIRTGDPHLQQGDLPAEPLIALISGEDGLDDIRLIISESESYLRPGGWLLLEHGYDQAGEVTELLMAAAYSEVFTQKDYAGNDRVSGGRKT